MAAWQILTDFDRQPMQRMHSVCMPKVSKDFSVCVHKWLCHDQLIRRIRSYLTRQWLLPIHICLKWNEKIMKSKWGAIKYLKPLNHLLHHQFHSISERLVSFNVTFSSWLKASRKQVQYGAMTWNDMEWLWQLQISKGCFHLLHLLRWSLENRQWARPALTNP